MSTEIEQACEMAYGMLFEHCRQFTTAMETDVTAITWRERCRLLVDNLEMLERCRDHASKPPRPNDPMPPPPPPLLR